MTLPSLRPADKIITTRSLNEGDRGGDEVLCDDGNSDDEQIYGMAEGAYSLDDDGPGLLAGVITGKVWGSIG